MYTVVTHFFVCFFSLEEFQQTESKVQYSTGEWLVVEFTCQIASYHLVLKRKNASKLCWFVDQMLVEWIAN